MTTRWLALLLIVGCDGGGGGSGARDAGADVGAVDARVADATRGDAGQRDGPDASLDAGRPDAGRPDAGRPDAGDLDAGRDAATLDAQPVHPDAADAALPADAEVADQGPDACVPACDGRACGDDGCGQTCGDCPPDAPLCDDGACQPWPAVIVSEVVSANQAGLVDGNGERSDWIELQNRGLEPVDLTGFALTDDLDEPQQWRFPPTILAPGEIRVVFASGQEAPEGELHASFRLRAEGEPLALVSRDGRTIIDQYDPLPALGDDVAFGVSQAVETLALVEPGQEAAWRVPAGPLPGWMDAGYDDGDWARGPTGLGYDLAGGPPPPEAQVELAAGRPARQSSTLGGFIADLGVNGDFADFTHTFRDDQAATWAVELAGDFWIDRVVLHNRRGCCGSRLRDITVRVLDAAGAEVYASPLLNPENVLGAPASIEVPVGGVLGRTVEVSRTPDLDLSGSNGQGNDDEPTVLSLGEVQVFGGADRIGAHLATDVEAALAGRGTSLYARVPFVVDDPATLSTLTLAVQTDAGFVAWINGVQVAAVRAPADVAWDAAATGEADDGTETVRLNVSGAIRALRPGANVLALQALNSRPDDDDLLLLPTLTAERVRDGDRLFFDVPTPGALNDQPGYLGFVAPVTVDVPSGLAQAAFPVTLATATPDAEIRYTLDGRTPTPEVGEIYREPLQIGRTTALRAMAWRPGYRDGPRTAATWIFPADVALQDAQATLDAGFPARWGNTAPDYGMDPRVIGPGAPDADRLGPALAALPTLAITTEIEGLFGPDGIYTRSDQHGVAWERAISADFFGPEGEAFQIECGLRIQGGAFRSHGLTLKHSLRLLFKSDYGPGKLRHPVFGPSGPDRFDTLTLRANSNDGWQWSGAGSRPLYIRDAFARATRRAMGGEASRGRFAHLYLNGIYWGVYEIVERPDAAYSATHFGGERDDWDAINSGTAVDGDLAAWNALIAALNAGVAADDAYRAVTGQADASQLIDPVDYADYMLTNLFVGNTDWPQKNYYLSRDRARGVGFRFSMWDAEWSMGIRSELDTNRVGVNVGVAQPWPALRQNAEFRLLVADRAHRHLFGGGALFVDPDAPAWDAEHPERNQPAARFMALADEVELALVAESARWGDQHAATPYTVDAHWRPERDRLLADYLPFRSGVFLDQLRAADLYPALRGPLFAARGGAVPVPYDLPVDAEGDRLYYTLDGTDPRLPGGDVSPTALEAVPGEPLRIAPAPLVRVRARAFAGGVWSALEEGTFEAAP
ncbi:MAG: CotH kinase family protein [Myxococcales bacterium]|nr:CotH kinase family protein [Myxococcales bacterium]